jgi:hypothetical protein
MPPTTGQSSRRPRLAILGAGPIGLEAAGFFILGSKSYGRNNSFLLRVGWDQVTEVFAALPADGGPGGH